MGGASAPGYAAATRAEPDVLYVHAGPVQAFADAVSIHVAVHPRGFSACPVRLRSRSGSVSRN